MAKIEHLAVWLLITMPPLRVKINAITSHSAGPESGAGAIWAIGGIRYPVNEATTKKVAPRIGSWQAGEAVIMRV